MTKYNELIKYSNPARVYENMRDYLNVPIYISDKPTKKYMVKKPDGSWVHFGEMGYQDFTKHQDRARQDRYFKRAMNIKGNWFDDPYSANNMAINLLWL
jgi:hypothetical protein